MSHLHMILVEFGRNRVRSSLTVAAIACAFLLFALLNSVRNTFLDAGSSAHGAARLVTQSRHAVSSPLPLALQERMATVSGLTAHGHATWFGGYYQQPSNPLAAFAISDGYLDVYPEIEVDPWARREFAAQRNGLLVGEAIARRFKWRVGQTVPLGSLVFVDRAGNDHWSFVIAGLLRSRDGGATNFHANTVLMHWDYLDAASPYVDGHVGWYASRVADVGRSDQLAREIDALSANSATETHTMSEQAAFAARVRQLGDIDLITRSIMSAVLFSLLFTTAWTMGQTLRERRSELATLRAIGFSTRRLALLLTAETILLFNAGCLLGLLVASAVIAVTGHVMGDVLAFATVTTADGFAAIGLALLLGCAVGAAASLRHLRGNISSVLVRH